MEARVIISFRWPAKHESWVWILVVYHIIDASATCVRVNVSNNGVLPQATPASPNASNDMASMICSRRITDNLNVLPSVTVWCAVYNFFFLFYSGMCALVSVRLGQRCMMLVTLDSIKTLSR
jgi:hypothetical protein